MEQEGNSIAYPCGGGELIALFRDTGIPSMVGSDGQKIVLVLLPSRMA